MDRRSWPLIAISFAALLTVVGLSARDVARQTAQLRADILTTQAQAQRREQVLRDVRYNSAALAIELRDALLDPGEISATDREELERLHQAVLRGLDRLGQTTEPSQADPVQRLRRLHEEYWQMALVPLSWHIPERRAKAARYLRDTLAPLRQSALTSTAHVETIEANVLQAQRVRIEESFSALDAALNRTLVITLSIGLAIAAITVWRFSRLEVRAARLQAQTHQDREHLRVLSQNLVHAHEDERRSLARELHDQIGQLLTAIQMIFNNIEMDHGDRPRHIEEGKALTERTVAAVRHISMGLRPSILDDLGLGPAIEWQAREFSKHSHVPVRLQMDGHLESLTEAQKTCLYRVIQEALTNCAKHAQAATVRINLHAGREMISLTIEDDGQGFDVSSTRSGALGLFGMQERVRELGGTLSTLSQPGKGTLLRVSVPSQQEVGA